MFEIFGIEKESAFEYVEKNSKFYAFSFIVEDCETVENILKSLKTKFSEATHICYAFALNNKEKYCDDGEPNGTAGKPILNVIKQNKLTNVLVAVIRYFGGIKLGAGGLCRAYNNCAKNVIKISGKKMKVACKICKFALTKNENKFVNLLQTVDGVKDIKLKYTSDIEIEATIESQKVADAISKIKNILSREIEIKIEMQEIFF